MSCEICCDTKTYFMFNLYDNKHVNGKCFDLNLIVYCSRYIGHSYGFQRKFFIPFELHDSRIAFFDICFLKGKT